MAPYISTLLSQRSVTTTTTSTDFHDDGWSTVANTGFWCFLALIIVMMRVYARVTARKPSLWDTVAIILTMIFGVGVWICFVGEAHWAHGKQWDTISDSSREMHIKYQLAHDLLLVSALQGMKIAFMLFLLLLKPSRIIRSTLYAVIGFTTVYTIANWLTILVACLPVSAHWSQAPAKYVTTYRGFGLSSSIFGMLADAVLVVLPVAILTHTQLVLRTKICLFVAFGLGVITVFCSAAKTYHQQHFFVSKDSSYQDHYFLWGAMELYIGIIASSLLTLKPLASDLFKYKEARPSFAASVACSQNPYRSFILEPTKLAENSRFQEHFSVKDFPRIEVSSTSSDDYSDHPDTPTRPEKFSFLPLNSNPPFESWPAMSKTEVWPAPAQAEEGPALPKTAYSSLLPKASRRRSRPIPLSSVAISRGNSANLASLGLMVSSAPPRPAPGSNIETLRLLQRRDPLVRDPKTTVKRRMSASLNKSPSLSDPSVGVLMTPSPTHLTTDLDLDFFNLIRGRSPETIQRELNARPKSMGCAPKGDSEPITVNFPMPPLSPRRSLFADSVTDYEPIKNKRSRPITMGPIPMTISRRTTMISFPGEGPRPMTLASVPDQSPRPTSEMSFPKQCPWPQTTPSASPKIPRPITMTSVPERYFRPGTIATVPERFSRPATIGSAPESYCRPLTIASIPEQYHRPTTGMSSPDNRAWPPASPSMSAQSTRPSSMISVPERYFRPATMSPVPQQSSRPLSVVSVADKYGRPLTIVSILDPDFFNIRASRFASGDFSESIATAQRVKRFGSGDVRRCPSMAPSAASSAYLVAPPVRGDICGSRMFLHIVPSHMFGDTSAPGTENKDRLSTARLSDGRLSTAHLSSARLWPSDARLSTAHLSNKRLSATALRAERYPDRQVSNLRNSTSGFDDTQISHAARARSEAMETLTKKRFAHRTVRIV